MRATVVGAGLAGCEAAWRLAQGGVRVTLIEMKPEKLTPAHHSASLSELVCSNSLKASGLDNACGLLKEELRRLGSLIIACADETRVPAGGALAVDREAFASLVTEKIHSHDNIELVCREAEAVPEFDNVIIATGPLTSDRLSASIASFFGSGHLSFFDAASPIVTGESVDMSSAFFASRYGKGEPDYINCPMNREEYIAFHTELVLAERAELHAFEKVRVFEGCMPVEVMAGRGEDTLRFGPLKPVGLTDPRTGERPYAVVQLRRENSAGTLYNLVGFQTNLKFAEQRRVFSMIPALRDAEFVRFGVMHRNTFLDSPRLLTRDFEARKRRGLFFAGQITGVEGYVESAMSGLVAGIALERRLRGLPAAIFPKETATGSLCAYISDESVSKFQPMNANFGIIPGVPYKIKLKRYRYMAVSARALEIIDGMADELRHGSPGGQRPLSGKRSEQT